MRRSDGHLALRIETAGETAAIDVEGFEDFQDELNFELPVQRPEDDVEILLAGFQPIQDTI